MRKNKKIKLISFTAATLALFLGDGGYEEMYYVQSCDLHISVCASWISENRYVFFSKGDGSDKGLSANWIKCHLDDGERFMIIRADLTDLGYTSDLLSGKRPAIGFQNIPGRFGRIGIEWSFDTIKKVHSESLDILLLNPVDNEVRPRRLFRFGLGYDRPSFSLFFYDGATRESIMKLNPIRVKQGKIGWIKTAFKQGLIKENEI